MFRYYSIMRPVLPGGFPKKELVEKIENFDTKTFCKEIGREAWGCLEYREVLTKEEADACDLVLGGMKTYYCVTTSVDDKGKVLVAITSVVQAESKPESSFRSLSRKDVYNDWFDDPKEAKKFVEEAKMA